MSHYETFVVRLWIEDGEVGHGEIRHLPTGTGLRFRRLLQAVGFIEKVAGTGHYSKAHQVPGDATAEAHNDVVVEFEGSPRS